MHKDKVYLVDYYGFVYIWRDNLKNKYYIGSHLGPTTDSYVGSNKWLKAAFKKRPHTFKRRILTYLSIDQGDTSSNLKKLHELEQLWLNLIDDSELSTSLNVTACTNRYYNMKKIAAGGSHKGHTKNRKSSSWNKGVTANMLNLRREGLFCLMCDRPKLKQKRPKEKVKHIIPSKCCKICHIAFVPSRRSRQYCSLECKVLNKPVNRSVTKSKTRIQSKPKKAWNKGISNPCSAQNGKKSATKQSATVTGRRIKVKEDGTRVWVYPHEPEYAQVIEEKMRRNIKIKNTVAKPKSKHSQKTRRNKFKKGTAELRQHLQQMQTKVAKRGLDHKDASLWILKSPEGQVLEVINLPKFCNDMNLAITAIQYNGAANTLKPIKKGKSKGWTVLEKRKGG